MTKVTTTEMAREVWQQVLGYFFAHREHTFGVVQALGLTPGHMKTLFELDPDDPRSMGEIADALACDASNATWMVDRLEERGLVERRAHPTDRRVKTVVLTPEGATVKQRMIDGLGQPPSDLVALDRSDLEALRAAVRLLPAHPPFSAPAPRPIPKRAVS